MSQRAIQRRPNQVARAVVHFVVAGVVAMAALSVGAALLLQRVGSNEAVRTATEVASTAARGVIQPNLTDGLVNGDPAELARFDGLVRNDVLGASVVRVKLWDRRGRIVYSDEPRLIGNVYPLGGEDLATLSGGRVAADLSNLSQPENRFERQFVQLLQVYQRVTTPGGTPLLFETYLKFSSVRASARRIWVSAAPALLGALVLLELVQVPLAVSLARSVRHNQQRQEVLLRRALDASDAERRRIAGDLHDGAVQDLAGVNYVLEAAAGRFHADGDAAMVAALHAAASGTRRSIRGLRTLMVEIYPPNLRQAGLESALRDLMVPLAAQGIAGHVDVAADAGLSDEGEALVYRTAQEAIRNVTKHAAANQLRVRVGRDDGKVVLEVADDGRGFVAAAALARPPEGHLGLRLLSELAVDAGGGLSIDSRPGAGTVLRLEIPSR
jgi:two-component system NarL family sensor kinase